MKVLFAFSAALFASGLPVHAQDAGACGPYAASPFRDKPAESYSSVDGPDHKQTGITWGMPKPEDFGPWKINFHYADPAANHDPTLTDTADKKKKIFNIPANAVSPDYKVPLFPYRKGNPIPGTTWNTDRTMLTVQFRGVTDTIRFAPAASGKTDISITREEGGQAKRGIQVDHPIEPMPDRPAFVIRQASAG